MARPEAGRGRLSHVDAAGRLRMVDVSDKPARGAITIAPAALRQIRAGRVAKGDPLQAARLAGIMAAKRTAELVPLCHPVPITHVEVELSPRRDGYTIEARVRTTAPTGVEMEALVAVAAAALTLYDMVKAVDRSMVIGDIRLVKKTGGRSGEYVRAGEL
jgi:cyclic pyranopterin phosphate synthase